jgi:hypothetical protein
MLALYFKWRLFEYTFNTSAILAIVFYKKAMIYFFFFQSVNFEYKK